MKIVGITKKDGSAYIVGETYQNMVASVERIVYKRVGNLFNSGLTNGEPSYIIHFTGLDLIRIVPEREIIEIGYDTAKEEKKKKSAVAEEMPDDFLE